MNSKFAWGAVAAVALLGSGAVSASIPSDDGSIDGCVNKATGVMRVIDAAKPGNLGSCITTGPALLQETPVSWNQAGQQGPQGPAGDSFGYYRSLVTGIDGDVFFLGGVAGLNVGCDADGQYYVRLTSDPSDDARLWIERSSTNTIDHIVLADVENGDYDVQLDGVADERLQLSTSAGEKVVNWDILATTEGGCRLNVTQPTVLPPGHPGDDPDGPIILD